MSRSYGPASLRSNPSASAYLCPVKQYLCFPGLQADELSFQCGGVKRHQRQDGLRDGQNDITNTCRHALRFTDLLAFRSRSIIIVTTKIMLLLDCTSQYTGITWIMLAASTNRHLFTLKTIPPCSTISYCFETRPFGCTDCMQETEHCPQLNRN